MSRTHDVVVLAIPFTTLRDVDLDVDLDRVPGKREAIDDLGYGTNAKMMVGFERPAMDRSGRQRDGVRRSRRTSSAPGRRIPRRATSTRGVLTDYSGGVRGASMDPGAVQLEASQFLADLNFVFPGAYAAARRVRGTSSRISSTGRRTRSRWAVTRATSQASSRRLPDSKGCPWATSSSPASTRIRFMCGRASWKGRRCRASMPLRRS